MSTPIHLERSSVLADSAERVWAHASSMAGVNAELAPVRMSHPEEFARLDAAWPGGETAFTSVLTIAGVPFDRHRLRLVDLAPGRWFQEDSSSLLHRRWRHRREVEPLPLGCRVRDRLEVEPRLPGSAPLTRWLVGRIFDRRHRELVRRFGDADRPVPQNGGR